MQQMPTVNARLDTLEQHVNYKNVTVSRINLSQSMAVFTVKSQTLKQTVVRVHALVMHTLLVCLESTRKFVWKTAHLGMSRRTMRISASAPTQQK
jgi:hypothetical protein